MLSVPLLFQVRLTPRVPPVTFDIEPSGVVSVEATALSMVPADQFNVPVIVIAPAPVKVPPREVARLMLIGPPPVNVPPLIVVRPLNVDAPATVRVPPAETVKLASQVRVLAFCPAVLTTTAPALEPMKTLLAE